MLGVLQHRGRFPLREEREALGEGVSLLCPSLPPFSKNQSSWTPEAHPDRGERKCTELGSTQTGQAPPLHPRISCPPGISCRKWQS